MSNEHEFRLKYPTKSDELQASQGNGAELPAPVKKRRGRTLSETLDDTIRAMRRQPTREQEALLGDIEERPFDASRVARNQRAIVERFQTVDRADAPNVHDLAPHLAARRQQLEFERTRLDDVLDQIRSRPEWLDYVVGFGMIGCSLIVVALVLARFVR